MHNLIYLSFLMNDFGLLNFVIAYIDMVSIIVHRDIVYSLRIYL